MIDVYYWPTPNGKKVTIFLEEAGLPYKVVRKLQYPQGRAIRSCVPEISPNNRRPIVDQDGPGGKPYSVFESGAILLYLADFARHELAGFLREIKQDRADSNTE